MLHKKGNTAYKFVSWSQEKIPTMQEVLVQNYTYTKKTLTQTSTQVLIFVESYVRSPQNEKVKYSLQVCQFRHRLAFMFNLYIKGPAHCKNENLYFLAPAKTKFAKKQWTSRFFCKLLLDGASHETKIGCISLVGRELKNINFHFFYAQTL